MKALSDLWIKITGGLHRFWSEVNQLGRKFLNVLHENFFSTCLILITIITFTLFNACENLKHAEEKFSLKEDNIRLQYVLRDKEKQLLEQDEYIKFQGEVMDGWRKRLESQDLALIQASDIINSYRATIDKLVEYLKRLGKWPPKIDPIDPDKWINFKQPNEN